MQCFNKRGRIYRLLSDIVFISHVSRICSVAYYGVEAFVGLARSSR